MPVLDKPDSTVYIINIYPCKILTWPVTFNSPTVLLFIFSTDPYLSYPVDSSYISKRRELNIADWHVDKNRFIPCLDFFFREKCKFYFSTFSTIPRYFAENKLYVRRIPLNWNILTLESALFNKFFWCLTWVNWVKHLGSMLRNRTKKF